jgi:hypothetical protein
VNCSVPAGAKTADTGEIEIDTPSTVSVAFAFAELSATLVAVIVWLPDCAGAVYMPDVVMVPELEFPPATPSTDHVTAELEKP